MSTITYCSVRVEKQDIFYREAGPKGAPILLLLHGFPTSSHMFRDLIPRLSDRYHLVAPDYPGFGYSSTPPTTEFSYTFDNLSEVMERFIERIGLTRYAIYMQDFGGPVGLRLASRHPQCVNALIVQNANAYVDGITDALRDVVLRAWVERTIQTEAALRALFELPVTKRQFLAGVPDPQLVSPDSWQHAQWGLDRPGNKDIQFALHANYGSNVERYDEWHSYFRTFLPPMLVVWGKGDPIFAEAGARAYRRDLPDAEIHLLDTGHFALETHSPEISRYMRAFLDRIGI